MSARRIVACLCPLLLSAGCRVERLEPEPAQSHERPSTPESPASEPNDVAEPEPQADPEPQAEPEPPPPPEPAPFAGRERVRVDELLAALALEVDALAASDEVRRDYEAFLSDFELEDSEALYLDYVRIKLAFEATRAGGWWGLAWSITNEEPRSDLIWAHWRRRRS